MIRRLSLAAVAAVSITACGGKPSSGPRTVLVEKDGRYAIAVEHGKSIEFYPLPAQATVMVDGKSTPLSTSAQVGIIPKCPCSVPDCSIYCRPLAAWWDEPVLTIDPSAPKPVPAQ